MSRIPNDIADLPPYVRAVFFRQYAREAESLAHKSRGSEGQASYRAIAEQWHALAEQADMVSGLYDLVPSPVRIVQASASPRL